MSATTLALPTAGGAASASAYSPQNRPPAAILSTTTLMMSSSSSFSAVAATRSLINSDAMIYFSNIRLHCCSTTSASITLIGKTRRKLISCKSATSSLSSSSVTVAEGEEEQSDIKIGARVRVKAPLKVYHVPRVPEVDLTGKEGHLKQYVGLWKGKRISANLPYKVEFVVDIEGRGPVKFFAHLKEDEFEYLD